MALVFQPATSTAPVRVSLPTLLFQKAMAGEPIRRRCPCWGWMEAVVSSSLGWVWACYGCGGSVPHEAEGFFADRRLASPKLAAGGR